MKESIKQRALRYKRDIVKVLAQNSIWRKANKGHKNSLTAKRRAAKLQATPQWADLEAIRSYYTFASFLTAATFSEGYHVDHIVPLQGTNVCGLHTEANLQVLRATDNMSKSNKWMVS